MDFISLSPPGRALVFGPRQTLYYANLSLSRDISALIFFLSLLEKPTFHKTEASGLKIKYEVLTAFLLSTFMRLE